MSEIKHPLKVGERIKQGVIEQVIAEHGLYFVKEHHLPETDKTLLVVGFDQARLGAKDQHVVKVKWGVNEHSI